MDKKAIYCPGGTPAARYACTYLKEAGFPVTDQPGPQAGHLLLDVPSFGPNGHLRLGGDIQPLLAALPQDLIVYGGNLHHPALQNHRIVDFLQDEAYLAQNAYITAECALDVALPYLSVTLRSCPVLIIGWGRIGKCLAQLLKSIGAQVTIAARKEADRAMIQALGYQALDTGALAEHLGRFRLVYNTVPALILPKAQSCGFSENCVLIELASKPGIEHEDVIIARGLPGIHMPESSGKLIAQTFIRYYHKEVTA